MLAEDKLPSPLMIYFSSQPHHFDVVCMELSVPFESLLIHIATEKSLLTYLPPLSYLMDLIFFPNLFSTKALQTFKVLNTSNFCFIKYNQQNLEQSSIKVRKYLDPFIDVVGIGLETSLCIRSSVEASLVSFSTSYLFSGCLPTKQPGHTPSDVWMSGKPSTILSL